MSGLNIGNVGIAGEVRCVIKREDGSVKEDTGFQKNLILNQGLDFFGGGKGTNMFYTCVIGAGNSTPIITQSKLDNALVISTGSPVGNQSDYVPNAENLYKCNRTYRFVFSNLNNVNVSEVGLASLGTDTVDYYLCTRALIKDPTGAPTSITILTGEVLEIYYKLWLVVSVENRDNVVNMLDAKGGSVAYNTSNKPALIGTSAHAAYNIVGTGMALNISNYGSFSGCNASSSPLGSLTEKPSGSTEVSYGFSDYTPGTYKRTLVLTANTGQVNMNIRSALMCTTMGAWQISFGSVAGDSPIPKTSLQTLSMPFEISWGRYEGVL